MHRRRSILPAPRNRRLLVPAPRRPTGLVAHLVVGLVTGLAVALGAGLVAGLAGCGPDGLPRDLQAIEEPDGFDAMSRPVQRQYAERREALDAALAAARDDSAATRKQLADAYGGLGHWFHAHRIFAPAKAGYENASRLAPDDVRWPYLLADVLGRLGETDAAKEQLRRATEARPDYLPAWISLAEIHLEAGEIDDARRHFERARDLDPESARALYGLGVIALDEGRSADALELLEAARERQPAATEVLYSLGLAHRRLGHREEAKSFLEQASIRENDERTLLDMADPAMAPVKALRQERGTLRVRTAEQLFEEGRYEESARLLRLALDESGDAAELRFLLGLVLRRLGDAEAAAEEIRRSIEQRPDYAPAHFQLGVLALETGDADGAEEHLRRALELDSGFRMAHQRLGDLLRQRGDCEAAGTFYAAALELQPALAPARFGLAACELRLGRASEAFATVARGLELDPDAARLRHLMARLLATHPDPARRDGERAVEMASLRPGEQANFQRIETLAMALADVGRFDEAVTWQRRVVAVVEQGGSRSDRWARERLASYEAGKPVRRVWGEGEPQSLSPLPPPARRRPLL